MAFSSTITSPIHVIGDLRIAFGTLSMGGDATATLPTGLSHVYYAQATPSNSGTGTAAQLGINVTYGSPSGSSVTLTSNVGAGGSTQTASWFAVGI